MPEKRTKKIRGERSHLTLTEETIAKAADIVARGNFRDTARSILGIPEGTWETWINRGRSEAREFSRGERKVETLKMKFVKELDRAEGQGLDQFSRDMLDPAVPMKTRAEFMYRRHSRLFSKNPKALDDRTGQEYETDPKQLLAEKLAVFLESEDDAEDEDE